MIAVIRVVGNMSIKLNALAGAGTRAGIPVLTYESPTKPFYLANPTHRMHPLYEENELPEVLTQQSHPAG